MKVCKIGEFRCNFCEVSDSCQMISPQVVRFNKDACLLETGKKVVVLAVEFDVAKASVAEHMASDTYI